MTTDKITPTREHIDVLLSHEILRNPDNWIKVAEFFEKPDLVWPNGICLVFGDIFENNHYTFESICYTLSDEFFRQFSNIRVNYVWPTTPEYYPARAAFCREVAELLRQIKFVDCTPDPATMIEILRRLQ